MKSLVLFSILISFSFIYSVQNHKESNFLSKNKKAEREVEEVYNFAFQINGQSFNDVKIDSSATVGSLYDRVAARGGSTRSTLFDNQGPLDRNDNTLIKDKFNSKETNDVTLA